jgi:hypothetical protein
MKTACICIWRKSSRLKQHKKDRQTDRKEKQAQAELKSCVIPMIIAGFSTVFSELVLKTVESCFMALNYYGTGGSYDLQQFTLRQTDRQTRTDTDREDTRVHFFKMVGAIHLRQTDRQTDRLKQRRQKKCN